MKIEVTILDAISAKQATHYDRKASAARFENDHRKLVPVPMEKIEKMLARN